MSGKAAIDDQLSTLWAIADITSVGLVAAEWGAFDLCNRSTGRAHRLHIFTGGFGFGFPGHGSVSVGLSLDYNHFTTRRPVNFDDFHLRGADALGLNAFVYSASRVRVFDGPALLSTPLLFAENFMSWGIAFPSIDLTFGVTHLEYGTGLAMGDWQPFKIPDVVFPPRREELDWRIRITRRDDSIVIHLPGDVLFDFNEYKILPAAVKILKEVGAIVWTSFGLKRIEVEGHTDSKGPDSVNIPLSINRSKAVIRFLKEGGLIRPGVEVKPPVGVAATSPVAPNTNPDGSDNPAGRKLNRRIEIYLFFR